MSEGEIVERFMAADGWDTGSAYWFPESTGSGQKVDELLTALKRRILELEEENSVLEEYACDQVGDLEVQRHEIATLRAHIREQDEQLCNALAKVDSLRKSLANMTRTNSELYAKLRRPAI